MKERPILFSGPMVRAILEGRKTQTRRVIKRQPPNDDLIVGPYHPTIILKDGEEAAGPKIFGAYDEHGEWGCKSPFGQPGDRLWVRTTWWHYLPPSTNPANEQAWDEFTETVRWADGKHECEKTRPFLDHWRKRPSIHMPRWASRITLEITGVRVERLQEISEEDALAEGGPRVVVLRNRDDKLGSVQSPREGFSILWDEIYGDGPNAWEDNPWVWAITFRRTER